MIKVEIKVKGVKPDQFIAKLKIFQATIDGDLINHGTGTVKAFGKTITRDRKRGPSRSGDRLANSINSEVTYGLITAVGVGNKAEMTSKAPYWKVVNYGGIIPPSAIGSFGEGNAPDRSLVGKGTEPWFSGRDGFFMKPKTPIRPMNFIETTINQISAKWSRFWAGRLIELWSSIPTPPSLTK